MAACGSGPAHNRIEVGVELWSTTSNVEGGDIGSGEQVQAGLHDSGCHHLTTIGTGIDMAVEAGLIAASTKVDLQHVDPFCATQRANTNRPERRTKGW